MSDLLLGYERFLSVNIRRYLIRLNPYVHECPSTCRIILNSSKSSILAQAINIGSNGVGK